MTILVTGANGFLGQHVCNMLRQRHQVVATGRGEKRLPFDDVAYLPAEVCDTRGVNDVVKAVQPQVIIHTAATSKPDDCLHDKAGCIAVNIGGTENFVSAAGALATAPHFVLLSSDFVLGDDGPHDETAPPAPLNFYGETKWMAERVVAESGLRHTIIRPVFMYGAVWPGMRSTFLHWVKQSLEERRAIKVVSDQLRTPTLVTDICSGIAAAVEGRVTGLFHLGGREQLTPYDMAVQLSEICGLDAGLIEPVNEATFPEPVKRAKRGGVVIAKAERELGFQPQDFSTALHGIFGRL